MLKNLPIQVKYLMVIIVIAIMPLVIMPFVGYRYTSNVLQEEILRKSELQVNRLASDFDGLMEDVISSSNVLALDPQIVEYLSMETRDNIDGDLISDKIYMVQASNLYSYNVETIVIDKAQNIYYSGAAENYDTSSIDIDGLREINSMDNTYFQWTNRPIRLGDNREGLTLVRSIKDEYFKDVGILAMRLMPDRNERYIGNRIGSDNVISQFIVDREGKTVFADRKYKNIEEYYRMHDRLLESGKIIDTINGQKMVITISKIRLVPWHIVQFQSYDKSMINLMGYRDWTITMNIIFVILILIGAYVASKEITKAIRNLNKGIEKAAKGDLKGHVEVTGSYEIQQLSSNFNGMLDEIEQLIQRVEYETSKKQEKRLEALQAQISPHFLLNTLNGVKWLVVMKDNHKAERMLLALGTLLERTLGTGKAFITLREELECLEFYCDIQKFRYGDSFDMSYDIDDDLLNIRVPALILQPLIENCIIHAFNEMDEQGRISVHAYMDGDFVMIDVIDNGRGMAEDMAKKVLKGTMRKAFSSIGVSNVRDRVLLYYKEPCDMEILSNEGRGTTIRLKIREHLEDVYEGTYC